MTLYGTEFFAGRSETVTRSAAVVVPVLCNLLKPTSVIDLGCGQGEWIQEFNNAGLWDVFGVDIAGVPDLNGSGFVYGSPHDLTQPLDLQYTFDLALCLEVGEHLPESAADTLVDTITRHSDTAVFSAAVPGQEGTGHINCQPHEYWHAKFRDRGYVTLDHIRPLIQDERVSPWYRNNVFLYVRP